jgi:hypothetical protein
MPGDTWASGWAGLAGRWEADVGDGIPLGRIAGIRVAASWTLLIVVALPVLGLAGGVFPRDDPSLAPSWYVAAAVVRAGLFLKLGRCVAVSWQGHIRRC